MRPEHRIVVFYGKGDNEGVGGSACFACFELQGVGVEAFSAKPGKALGAHGRLRQRAVFYLPGAAHTFPFIRPVDEIAFVHWFALLYHFDVFVFRLRVPGGQTDAAAVER